MRKSIWRGISGLAVCAALAACSTAPSTGPSAGAVAKQAARLDIVSPQDAAALWSQQKSSEQARIADTLAALANSPPAAKAELFPGARLNVILWTEPQLDGAAGDLNGKRDVAARADLGVFVVDEDGAVTLPYLGKVTVANLDLDQATRLLQRSFAATRRFQSPQVNLVLQTNPRQQITVSGSVNHPAVITWREGGVTLSEAIADAGGSLIYEQNQSHALTVNHVVLMRSGIQYDLPLKAALQSDVQLRPGDQVLLQHQAVVNVTCLGGGWPQNTVQSFDETPSLARVVAAGGGLSSQQANGSAVFVLSADRRTIYQFPWGALSGLQAAQTFPMQDGDIIYIATAPMVRVQQVTNILFSAAYPITAIKSVY